MSKALERKLSKAESYQQWCETAIALDQRSGAQKWKHRQKSRRYDYASIHRRLEALKAMRRAKDNAGLLFTLNEGIHGNLGGMGNSALYRKAKFGTKQLIIDYVEQVNSALEHLAKPRLKGVSIKEKIDFFDRAKLCFGQTALIFSGSGTYLFFHIGVLKALWQQNLLPNVLSGSSGGALVAAVAGTRKPSELGEAFEPEFLEFEDSIKAIVRNLSFSKNRSVRKQDLMKIIERIIPDLTFAEAYKISGLQINISIAPHERHQRSRLLNAITSPNVMLREAVLASCCIPGVFPPVSLAAKNVKGERVPYLPARKWVDGSISDDVPMKRLSRLYSVNHFIVSQTNPLALPFINTEQDSTGLISTVSRTAIRTFNEWGMATTNFIQKPLSDDSYLRRWMSGYLSLVSQTYTGDINILPSKRYLNPTNMLAARSLAEVHELMKDGERMTWPMLERIRIQTKISRTLSRLKAELDDRVLSSQKAKISGAKAKAAQTKTKAKAKPSKTKTTKAKVANTK